MRTGLSLDDLGDLLELPIVAVLATYRRDGTVMLSPVWHEWRDEYPEPRTVIRLVPDRLRARDFKHDAMAEGKA